MGLEDVLAALVTDVGSEDRIPEYLVIQRSSDAVFMIRCTFVGEDEYETYHIGLP